MLRTVSLAAFMMILLSCFLIITNRSQVIAAGNKIIMLQKELRELREVNDKLKNEYRNIATAENIMRKNEELGLALVPPEQVIRIGNEETEAVISMHGSPEGTDVE